MDATLGRAERCWSWSKSRCPTSGPTIIFLTLVLCFVINMLIPTRIRGVSRDVPEAEQGAVPGTRVVTGFLGSVRAAVPDVETPWWSAGRRHKPLGAGRRSAPPYWGKEKRTKGWPGTQFHRAAERWLRGLIDNRIRSDAQAAASRSPDERASAKSGAAYQRGSADPGFPPHQMRGHRGYTSTAPARIPDL
jgi:hypothetical protein